eukprot:gene19768-6919_t
MHNCNIDDNLIKSSLVRVLPSHPLAVIDVTGCPLTRTSGVVALIAKMPNVKIIQGDWVWDPSIGVLDLSGKECVEAPVEAIDDIMNFTTALEVGNVIDLKMGFPITKRCGVSLSYSTMPHLKSIVVEGQDSNAGLEEFVKQHPAINITANGEPVHSTSPEEQEQ